MTITESIIADFHQESELTRQVLAAVPEDRFDWKPHAKSMTLGELAGHVAESPGWVEAMAAETFDMADADGGDYEPFVPGSSAELLETCEAGAKTFVKTLEGKDDAFMTATWTMTAGGKTLMSSPRHAAIRSVLLRHVSHHRGQLTVYLRLLDLPVPPTYGPTADFPDAF